MIDGPPETESLHSPLHCFDILTLDTSSQAFRVWIQEDAFQQKSVEKFGKNFCDHLKKSVGCVVHSSQHGRPNQQVATAFVVSCPNPGTLTYQGQNVKALLLTSAHLFFSPFDQIGKSKELFFTLAPDLAANTLNSYSQFKIHRLFDFELFKASPLPFSDPMSEFLYMLPDDVDLVAILDDDASNQIRTYGNDFEALMYEDSFQDDAPCVLVGYPGVLNPSQVGLWAPKASQNPDLRQKAQALTSAPARVRAFSIGEILKVNETCVAVTASSWAGMSGGPLCLSSKDKSKIVFGGVYIGSAAVIFQRFVCKLLFRLQGHPIPLVETDLPKFPTKLVPEEDTKFWINALQTILQQIQAQLLDTSIFMIYLSTAMRSLLSLSEYSKYEVNHNLATKGGERFVQIIKDLDQLSQFTSPVSVEIAFPNFKIISPDAEIFNVKDFEKNCKIFDDYNKNDKGAEYLSNTWLTAGSLFRDLNKGKSFKEIQEKLDEVIENMKALILGWDQLLR